MMKDTKSGKSKPEKTYYIIRDTDDGAERTTLHMKVTQYSLFGLRKQMMDKLDVQRHFLLTAYAVLADVWTREPFLMVVLAARKLSDMLYSILQTYCETKMVMLTQAYVSEGHLPLASILYCLSSWFLFAAIKKTLDAKTIFYQGRFYLLYNVAIQKSLLQATENINLENRERASTKSLLEEAQKLLVTSGSFMDSRPLPDLLLEMLFEWTSFPLRVLAVMTIVPRALLPLVVAKVIYQLVERPVRTALSGQDWSRASGISSITNPLLVRMARLYDLGTDSKYSKDVQLLGISRWITTRFTSAAASLSPHVAATGELADDQRAQGNRNMQDSIRAAVALGIVVALSRAGSITLTAATYAVVESSSLSFYTLLQRIDRLHEIVGFQTRQFTAYEQYLDLSRQSLKADAARQSMPMDHHVGPGLPISFRNVSFKYPNSEDADRLILRNLSFEIPAGALVAVVGYNGAGKSSLISALTGAYNVQSGEILINEVNINSIDRHQLVSNMSVLPQGSSLFDLPLRENIAFWDCENDNVVRRAVEASDARTFIERLDNGYESCTAPASKQTMRWSFGPNSLRMPSSSDHITLIDEHNRRIPSNSRPLIPEDLDTSKEENCVAISKLLSHDVKQGCRFSGGEQQKVVLSRAFAKNECPLAVFDEPASNLDPESEHQLFKEIGAMKGKKTIIHISHRWRGITDKADLVLFMADGTIKEEGTHRSLLAKDGNYARLWRLQTESEGLSLVEEEPATDIRSSRVQ